jgi:putative oligomerization/nucleic acid binding protein
MAVALSACGSMGLIDDPSKVVRYEYRPPFGFVRIERIEAGAPDNAHPFGISVDALRQSLASLKVEGAASIGTKPVFTDGELKDIVPHLVAALATAGPREDVTFAVTGQHESLFGAYASKSATTGRLFAHDGQLNIIFGLIHELYEGRELGQAWPPPFPPGSRARRSDAVWKIVPTSGRLADARVDWVVLDAAKAQAPEEKTGASAPTPSAADSRYREIEDKLGVLNRLKEKGLITEEEYNERRRAILQGL